jgi:SAM-dependent methyltransferase
MASVSQHYDQHLGPIYEWMCGEPAAALAAAAAELRELGVPQWDPDNGAERGLAVDLGAGFGAHAVALTALGYEVVAVERCRPLLERLAERAASQPIRIVDADLCAFAAHLRRPADLVLCMGDTLTHLPDAEALSRLLHDVAHSLARGGRFITTFRDYSVPLEGPARFIAVRSTAEQLLTCFLEYGPQHVQVHDIVQRQADGRWQMTVSSYPKLRLDKQRVAAQLASLGLAVHSEVSPRGMIRMIAAHSETLARNAHA